MQADATPSEHRVQGQIKWFDPVRGFGFLADSSGGPDVLLHANVLRSFGQSSVADGALVEVTAIATARGRQAVEVVAISPPPSAGQAPIADLDSLDLAALDALPLLPARVKWFDKGKGFGFANIFGKRGDVFLHVEVLRHWGFADLVPGEAVGLRIIDGPRGMMAAQIVAWDRAATAPTPAAEGIGDVASDAGGAARGAENGGDCACGDAPGCAHRAAPADVPRAAATATAAREVSADGARDGTRELSLVLNRMRGLSQPDLQLQGKPAKVAG